MIWSKLKKTIKEKFSDKLKKEIDFFMTEYGENSGEGRAWITIKGKEIVNFSTA